MIKKIIVLLLIPIIILITGQLTALEENSILPTFELISVNTDNSYNITSEFYQSLNKDIKNYGISGNYINNDDIKLSFLKLTDNTSNSIATVDNQKLLNVNVESKNLSDLTSIFYNNYTSYQIPGILPQSTVTSNYSNSTNVLNNLAEYISELTLLEGNSIMPLTPAEQDKLNYPTLPNGVKNYITYNGQYPLMNEYVGKKVLQASDITQIYTTWLNVDLIFIKKPISSVDYNSQVSTGKATIDGIITTAGLTDSISSIGKVSANNQNLYYVFGTAKNTYTDLPSAQSAFTNKVLFYQLTVPNPKTKQLVAGDINSQDANYYYINKSSDMLSNGIATIDGVNCTVATYIQYPIASGTPIGKTLTYQLASPRLAEVTGIDSVKNPKVTIGDTFTQFNVTLRKKGEITDKVYYKNGNWILEKNISDNYEVITPIEEIINSPTVSLFKYPVNSTLTLTSDTEVLPTVTLSSAPYSKYNTVSNLSDYTIFGDRLIIPKDTDITDKYLEYQLLTPYSRPVNSYNINNFSINYDAITENYIFNINNGYNTFTISPNNILTVTNGYQYIGNNYTVRGFVYYIDNSYIRNIINIIPLIYIGSALVFCLFYKND